jgi:uncharacterized membrane protein YdjX (TVP38/TMEM64 family)
MIIINYHASVTKGCYIDFMIIELIDCLIRLIIILFMKNVKFLSSSFFWLEESLTNLSMLRYL